MNQENLDYLAAQCAANLVENTKNKIAFKDLENLLTKSLGVLQNQGVYAVYLYLLSQATRESEAAYILFYLWNLLSKIPGQNKIELQKEDTLFCDPSRKIRLEHKEKQQAEKNKEILEGYRDIVLREWKFGEKTSQAMPDKEALKKLEFNIKPTKNNHHVWIIEPSNQETYHSLQKLPAAREIILTQIRNLSKDLDTLLLVRDLYEQTLIYARYHAKALGG